MRKIVLMSSILFILDQVAKIIIGFSIDLNTSVTIIKDFFYISNVHNYGAAFSILYGNTIFLIIISLVALFLIYHFMLKGKVLRKIDIVTYSLLIGGIFGNLFDRVIYGYVVDFFDFNIFGYSFPVFNVADICIVVSVLLLIIDSLRSGKNEIRS